MGRKTILRDWEELPKFMQVPEVKPYYKILNERRTDLVLKRIFDFVVAGILLFLLAFPMLVIAILIKLDSSGPVFYRQERVTTYGRRFHIHKFRTMIDKADKEGTAVTVSEDSRITKIGGILRIYRLDEIPQLIDILTGNMSFVGTRPEVTKYVKKYQPEMRATLLLPAGVTSEASIRYKDESRLLNTSENVEEVYIRDILPAKMALNLEYIKKFSVKRELRILFQTVRAVFGKE